MSDVPSIPPTSGGPAASAVSDADARASEVAAENDVHYVPGEHKFQIILGGKPVTISPLQAVSYVMQNRYLKLTDVTAGKTKEMQDSINLINESNSWMNAIKAAQDNPPVHKPGEPSAALQTWMDDNDIDIDSLGRHPSSDTLQTLVTKFSNHVDQLSSTNDLKMLSLKTVVNKSGEALEAANGIWEVLKQLNSTIINNIAR